MVAELNLGLGGLGLAGLSWVWCTTGVLQKCTTGVLQVYYGVLQVYYSVLQGLPLMPKH